MLWLEHVLLQMYNVNQTISPVHNAILQTLRAIDWILQNRLGYMSVLMEMNVCFLPPAKFRP